MSNIAHALRRWIFPGDQRTGPVLVDLIATEAKDKILGFMFEDRLVLFRTELELQDAIIELKKCLLRESKVTEMRVLRNVVRLE